MMQKAYVIADVVEYKEPAEDDHGYYAGVLGLFHEKVSSCRYRMGNISPNRVRFNSVAELADYYSEKMSNGEIDESNIYDFLLTLVEYEERNYDSEGYLLCSRIKLQELDGNREKRHGEDLTKDISIIRNGRIS